MCHWVRHPHRNATILGLLQGVPQGLFFADQKVLVNAGFGEADLVWLVCFGLLGPPVMMAVSHFLNGRRQAVWWRKISAYVPLPQMIFWTGVSLGALGYCSLKANDAQDGFAICWFFIAAGVGFLFAGFVEQWLTRFEERQI